MTRPPPRSTLFPYTTLSRPPTAAVACLRDGYRGVGQRRRAECAGLVCLELYPRELGGVTKMKSTVAIIGAGPAGLTAAYLLSKNKVDVTVLEADPIYVGGISRTSTYKGFHFDIGGHSFFSKSKAIEDVWTDILPNDMLPPPPPSTIYSPGKFFPYPLKPLPPVTHI